VCAGWLCSWCRDTAMVVSSNILSDGRRMGLQRAPFLRVRCRTANDGHERMLRALPRALLLPVRRAAIPSHDFALMHFNFARGIRCE
jgi:hypothetical protein